MCGHTRGPVIYSKFHRNPFRGFRTPGGQNLAFPITLASRFYNSLYYRTSRHHRLRGSASPVLTATGFVNGKGQFSTPHRVDTPQPITKIFVTGDYVGDPYGCAKLGAYP